MKRIIYCVTFLTPALIVSMTKNEVEKPSQIVLDNSKKFTPQILAHYQAPHALICALKNPNNLADLRFLAFRLYFAQHNSNCMKNLKFISNHSDSIPEDSIISVLPLDTPDTKTDRIYCPVIPKILAMAHREDWTPTTTSEVLDYCRKTIYRIKNA